MEKDGQIIDVMPRISRKRQSSKLYEEGKHPPGSYISTFYENISQIHELSASLKNLTNEVTSDLNMMIVPCMRKVNALDSLADLLHEEIYYLREKIGDVESGLKK